ncbi:hypothetical protein ACQ4PT_041885 [Festuca glaucescens]
MKKRRPKQERDREFEDVQWRQARQARQQRSPPGASASTSSAASRKGLSADSRPSSKTLWLDDISGVIFSKPCYGQLRSYHRLQLAGVVLWRVAHLAVPRTAAVVARGRGEKRRKHASKAPTLPIDILLEIVSRADAATLVRCAAASKYLRRHITGPAFLLRCQADVGFVPSHLLGMFQQHGEDEPYRFVPMPPSTKFTPRLARQTDAADDFFGSCTPVASRAGLVLLRRVGDRNLVDLCVWSPVTGRYAFLPPATLYDYSHVLLHGDEDDNTGHPFRLLVVDRACQTQIFSSGAGWPNPITETPGALRSYRRVQPAAVVLGGVVHWLYHDRSSKRYQVLAVRTGDGHAAAIGEVPESCLRRRRRNILLQHLGLLLTQPAEATPTGVFTAVGSPSWMIWVAHLVW